MKKITFTLVASLAALCAMAQTKFWVCKSNGTYVEYLISETDSITFNNPFSPTTIVEKCKASDYAQITIGSQTWMAENYRCSKYDTQSEAYNAKWLTNNTIFTSESLTYTPYYTDASDKSNWIQYSQQYAGNLSDAQVAKLGFLYNWAAAVGVEDGKKYGTTPFTGNRQGICPNGWHLPSKAEWSTLANYIDNDDGMINAGQKLKTTSGWYENGNGTDTYGFAALPASYSSGRIVYGVGASTHFWSATPGESYGYAYYRLLHYCDDYLTNYFDSKTYGLSVRRIFCDVEILKDEKHLIYLQVV